MRHIAILETHTRPTKKKAIIVPEGQGLDFDEGTEDRKWLWPYIGTKWHLREFIEIICDAQDKPYDPTTPAQVILRNAVNALRNGN